MFSMLWKEWRENRAMLLAVLVAVLALLPALRALDIIQDFSDDYLVSQIVIVVLSACIGASLVGSEVSRGTLDLLWTRPVARWRLWAAKACFGLVACLAICLALGLTVQQVEQGAQRYRFTHFLVWPYEATLALTSGLFFSAVVHSPLTAGLLGFAVAFPVAAGMFVLPVRIPLFWPVSVCAFLLASAVTFHAALEQSARRRFKFALAGAAAGFLLFPVTYGAGRLAADAMGPRRFERIEECARVPGSDRLVIEARVAPSLFEPMRSPGSSPWQDDDEARLAVMDPKTGALSWLASRAVKSWSVDELTGMLAGISTSVLPMSDSYLWVCSPTVSNPAERLFSHPFFPPWPSYRHDWWSIGMYSQREALRELLHLAEGAGVAAAPPAGKLGRLFLAGNHTSAIRNPDGAGMLFQFDSPNDAGFEPRMRGRWRLDPERATVAPARPLDDKGNPLPGARFVENSLFAGAPYDLLVLSDGQFGLCRLDGSSVVRLDGAGLDASERPLASHLKATWSPDCREAVLQLAVKELPDHVGTSFWHVDRAARRCVRLGTSGLRFTDSLRAIPMPGGAYLVPKETGSSERTVLWAEAGPTAAVKAFETTGRLFLRALDAGNVAHPFMLEWLPRTGPFDPDCHVDRTVPTGGLTGPRLGMFHEVTPSGAWHLLVLRSPRAGGISVLQLDRMGSYDVPAVMMRGRKALVRQALAPVFLVDADHARPEPVEFDPTEQWIEWVQWLDDDTALAGTPYLGLWRLDCRSMTTRQILATTRDSNDD